MPVNNSSVSRAHPDVVNNADRLLETGHINANQYRDMTDGRASATDAVWAAAQAAQLNLPMEAQQRFLKLSIALNAEAAEQTSDLLHAMQGANR